METKIYNNFIRYEITKNKEVEILGVTYEGTKITQVDIPSKIEGCMVTTIAACAFADCTNLQHIKIPDSVLFIGENAFQHTAYVNNEKNWEDGLLYIGKHLIKAKHHLSSCHIKEGTIMISRGTFMGKAIKEISLPDSLIAINEMAFYQCVNLTNIILPKNLNHIGSSAFFECVNLQKIILPYCLKTIPPYCFYKCRQLNDVILPSRLLTIDKCAFAYCTELSIISLPSSLIDIREGAFINTNIQQITIPNRVTYIRPHTFKDCKNLTDIKLPYDTHIIGEYAFSNCINLTDIKLPSDLCFIEEKAFQGCNLNTIKIPYSVRYIADTAFDSCVNLREIIIKTTTITLNSRGYVTSPTNINSYGCQLLTAIREFFSSYHYQL